MSTFPLPTDQKAFTVTVLMFHSQRVGNKMTIPPGVHIWVITICDMEPMTFHCSGEKNTPSNRGSSVSVSWGRFPVEEFSFIWSWHALPAFNCLCQIDLQTEMCEVSVLVLQWTRNSSRVFIYIFPTHKACWKLVVGSSHLWPLKE